MLNNFNKNNMATHNQQDTAGRRFRVNHVPQASGNAAEIEDSNSVPSLCDIDTSRDIDTPCDIDTSSDIDTSNGVIPPSPGPPVGHNDSATPKRPQPARPNKRNYKLVSWSVEEKSKILYCFAYSRHEGWGRTKAKVFQDQLELTDLCKQKLQTTSVKNLASNMSRVEQYIPKHECDRIRAEGHAKAEQDLQSLDENKKQGIAKDVWSRLARWTLLWATEYAKLKTNLKQNERCKLWQGIFYHHCPDKRDIPKLHLSRHKGNFIKQQLFGIDEFHMMKRTIKNMIENDICPLENPVPFPGQPPPAPRSPDAPAATPEETHVSIHVSTTPAANAGNIADLSSQTPAALADVTPQDRMNTPATPAAIAEDMSVNSLPSPVLPATASNSPETSLATPGVINVSMRRTSTPAATAVPGGDINHDNVNVNVPVNFLSSPENTQTQSTQLTLSSTEVSFVGDEYDEHVRTICDELLNTIEEVKRVTMEERPHLIKLVQNKTLKTLTHHVNTILHDLIPEDLPLLELNNTSFGAALFIQRKIAPWYDEKRKKPKRGKKNVMPWKYKLQKKVDTLRKELSLLTTKEPLTKHTAVKIRRIHRKYKIKEGQVNARIAEHKMDIKGIAANIRSREDKENSKSINLEFAKNPRKVYRDLINDNIEVTKPPEKEDLEEFWRPLYETEKTHVEHEWIDTIKSDNETKPEMPSLFITTETVTKKITQYGNFKSPGIDKIPNFWLKKLNSLHPHYACSFNKLVTNQELPPAWLTHGSTKLLPKSKETQKANKYRPICCLSTTYKLLTGIIADSIYDHLNRGNFLEEEQKGCIRDRLGTKDQLLINKTILEDCRRRQRNLSMAWIDYRKAFDSVPHSWISRCLELYKVDATLREFLTNQMSNWKTDITLNHSGGEIHIPDVKIKRGIFQGDSLSPLLFCLTMDPLSKLLKKQNIGYDMNRTKGEGAMKQIITHLLFMDDLKLYANNDENLHKLVQTVQTFSKDVHMDFGLDKCAKSTIRQGKKVESEDLELNDGSHITDLEKDSTYKYLGIEENARIEHKMMRKKAFDEYVRRLKKICKSQLTIKNKVRAINQLAVPVVSYGFGVIDWPQKDLNALDIKTRKILTYHKMIYRNQCLDRLYLPRSEGGIGLVEINSAHRGTIISLGQYLISSTDPLMKIVTEQHRDILPQNISIVKMAKNFGNDLIEDPPVEDGPPATAQGKFKRKAYGFLERNIRMDRWRGHLRAGKFPQELDKPYIDKKTSLSWLRSGRLGFDGERVIIAAQDQGLVTNGFKKMAGLSNNDKCRFCKEAVESPSHLMSACSTLLADGFYTARHNRVCSYLHWTICRAYGIETKKVWEHEPQSVTATEKVSITYDKPIVLGRYVEGGAIKPDIIVWDHENKSAKIIEVSVPNDYGLNVSERKKISKYQDLKNDLRNTWELDDIEIIPIIIGATGLVKDNFVQYMKSIPGAPRAEEAQLQAVKGTITLLKRALSHTEL